MHANEQHIQSVCQSYGQTDGTHETDEAYIIEGPHSIKQKRGLTLVDMVLNYMRRRR